MPARSDFLLEIGVEELPPRELRRLDRALSSEFRRGLEEAGLDFDEVESFASPRRLAVVARRLATRQPSRIVEKRGPPLAAARGPDCGWRRGARGPAHPEYRQG